METRNNYTILKDSVSPISLEEYSVSETNSNKYLKIGVLGTILLCNTPAIYANDINISYKISDVTKCDNIENLEKQNNSLDNYIDSLSNIDKINYSYSQILKNILSFRSLKNNWDGYGALPLEVQSASNAILILNRIGENLAGRVEDFYPNTHGTISFEWINELGEKLYLEVGNETFNFFVKFNSLKPLFHNDLKITNENIKLLSSNIKAI